MATVTLGKYDHRSPFWYISFTDPATKRRLKKSTGTTDKATAHKFRNTMERAIDDASRHTLVESRTRDLLNELMVSIGGTAIKVWTVREWFEHFVSQKQASRAAKTGTRHKQTMELFFDHLGPKADLNIASITAAEIAAFRDRRQSTGLAAKTLNIDLVILGGAFGAAIENSAGCDCSDCGQPRD